MRNTLERIDPDNINEQQDQDETVKLHLERYQFAGKHLVKGSVADVACGSGYGSYLLATKFGENIDKIIAIDNYLPGIEKAKTRFIHPKISFVHADATTYQAESSFHNIVSLETIEHLPDPKGFINHFTNQLTIGGRFIVSVPITPSMDANPFHLHDFNVHSFLRMFEEAGLQKIHSEMQRQSFSLLNVLRRKEPGMAGVRKNLAQYYLQHPSKLWLRIRSTLSDGFVNKYLLAVFEKK